jgi:hypothetical protein
MRLTLALLAATLLAFVPMGTAQEHNHMAASGVVVSHDGPADGRMVAGDLAHFDVLDLGKDAVPDFHQQNHIRVTWNDVVLFETTADSGHDYDGVNSFDVVFPGPGPYMVEDIGDDGAILGMFMGTVVAPLPGSGATIALEAPASATVGVPVTFTYKAIDAAGAMVPHSDAWFEVRDGTQVVFRTKTHTHTEDQSLQYTFQQAGTYTVRITAFLAYPSGKETNDFAPVVTEKTIQVAPGVPVPAAVLPMMPPSAMNAVATGTAKGGNFTIVGTYDPYTVVGTSTLQHLTALVMDPTTHLSIQHVNFEATLTGPFGQVFSSKTLHEYDGIYDVAAVAPIPGIYTLSVDATQGAWSGHVDLPYTVLPPVEPVAVDVPPQPGLGPVFYDVAGLDGAAAGKALDVTITSRSAAGTPFPHSEIDVQVLDANKVPIITTKLHTHSDGKFPFTVMVPQAGDYTLRLSPFPLDPSATPLFYGSSVGAPLDTPFKVGAGSAMPASTAPAVSASHDAPALPLAFLAVGLAVALVVRRRQA